MGCPVNPNEAAGRVMHTAAVCTENHAYGKRLCAWFSERLYTRPLADLVYSISL